MKITCAWRNKLLDWYRCGGRYLPWRQTHDPYAILVSEMMLQQTRVETVIRYYQRFLERFPDTSALAEASETEVLKLWEGLGYYSRARNLQKTARLVAEQSGGRLPATLDGLRALPGVGEYTAGAVASIAYNMAVPAVDGNVKRVAARMFGIREPIDTPKSRRMILECLKDAMPADAPGDFNQALMELGATVCLPRAPQCLLCPIRCSCDAYTEGDAESLPILLKKQAVQTVDVAVCLLTFGDAVLVFRRRERLLHGLYVFFLVEGEATPQAVREAMNEQELLAGSLTELGKAKHIFTHRVWQMRLYHGRLTALPPESWLSEHQARMVNRAELARLPLPTAIKTAREAAERLLIQAEHTDP